MRPNCYDRIIANMVLMNTPALPEFLSAAIYALKPGGKLVCTMTHPCFWPKYKDYDTEPWFKYNREIFVETPFTISLSRKAKLRATHIHRPLSQYMDSINEVGFDIECLNEPMPASKVQSLYPAIWRYPRYMALRLAKPITQMSH